MRRAVGVAAVFAVCVALYNCRVGNPHGSLPRVGVAPPELEARFNRPATWEWAYFENADGARLRYGSAKPLTPIRAWVVIVGGYTEFAEKYYEFMNDLLARGYAVSSLDWRGQGGSERYLTNPQMAHSIGFEHDRDDLAQYLRMAVDGPVYLVAHSMGGNIALRTLHEHPDLVRAAVLSTPALRIGSRAGMPAWRARALAGLMIAAGLGESYALGQHDWRDDPARNAQTSPVTHDAARDAMMTRWFRERPELRVGGGTYRWAYEFYQSCGAVMNAGYLEQIRTPILMGSAGEDTFVEAAAHEEACKRLPNCQLVKYPGSRHELLMETDAIRTLWVDEIDRFVTEASK